MAQEQYVARISPKRPLGSPGRVVIPWMEGLGRRDFDVDLGFVPVKFEQVDLLRDVHCDGELTERGGQGPFLFEVVTAAEAQAIVQREQKAALLAAAGNNAALKAAFAGVYTDEELQSLGAAPGKAMSAADIARARIAKTATQAATQVAPEPASAEPQPAKPQPAKPAQGRVGRRPAKKAAEGSGA